VRRHSGPTARQQAARPEGTEPKLALAIGAYAREHPVLAVPTDSEVIDLGMPASLMARPHHEAGGPPEAAARLCRCRSRAGREIVPGMAASVTVPPFSAQADEQVCKALAEAVTGAQIPNLLVPLEVTELARHDVHPDVLRFCRAELMQQNYFHAVLEAAKSVADKLRTLASVT
jgi:Protein of unknown function (Hypoth_ymh)